MTNLLYLALGLQILLLVKSTSQFEENSTTVRTGVGFTQCEKGKQYYDFNKGRCRRCPRCKKSNNFLLYNLKISSEFGALECYPCYCKPGKKAYDPETKRCFDCPCNKNGVKNTTANLKISSEYGALECYPCYCKPGKQAYDPETKRCIDCPCNKNGVKNSTADVRIDELFGALDCYPCVCKHGFFATAFTHYQCVDCINCRQQNKKEIRQCSPTANAECGDCLDGYSKIDGMTCDKKPSTTPMNNLMTVGLPTEPTVPSLIDHGQTVKGSQIITVVILVIVVFIAIVTIYLCYGYITKRSSDPSSLDNSFINSGTTLSSQNSVRKSHAEHADQTLESTNVAASDPLLTNDTDLAQDTVQDLIQEHIGSNQPIGTVVLQIGDGNKVILNPLSSDTSI